jgi:hypothetical protein
VKEGVTYCAIRIKDLDAIELGILGDSVGLGSNCPGDMCSMAVTVRVRAITGKIGKKCGTTLKLRVRSGDTSINHISARASSSTVIVVIACLTTVLVRNTRQTPG